MGMLRAIMQGITIFAIISFAAVQLVWIITPNKIIITISRTVIMHAVIMYLKVAGYRICVP